MLVVVAVVGLGTRVAVRHEVDARKQGLHVRLDALDAERRVVLDWIAWSVEHAIAYDELERWHAMEPLPHEHPVRCHLLRPHVDVACMTNPLGCR